MVEKEIVAIDILRAAGLNYREIFHLALVGAQVQDAREDATAQEYTRLSFGKFLAHERGRRIGDNLPAIKRDGSVLMTVTKAIARGELLISRPKGGK